MSLRKAVLKWQGWLWLTVLISAWLHCWGPKASPRHCEERHGRSKVCRKAVQLTIQEAKTVRGKDLATRSTLLRHHSKDACSNPAHSESPVSYELTHRLTQTSTCEPRVGAFHNSDQLISSYKSTKKIQWRKDVLLSTKVLKQAHANEEL